MHIASDWNDYELIDCGNGEKLERWKNIILRRPEPQAIWPIQNEDELWLNPHAHYHRNSKGGGYWEYKQHVKDEWNIQYKGLTFKVSPTGFKHTGLFPEQASNWDLMMKLINEANRDDLKILNLFAYTGGATMACAKAGASEVVHVDASKGIIQWAKENMERSKLSDCHIRFIVDDVMKFVQREKRRGRKYHAIIMDPPSYGRGPNKEVWKLEDQLYGLINACVELLADDALFLIVNCYTTGFSPTILKHVLNVAFTQRFPNAQIDTGELALPISKDNSHLPCGIVGRVIL